MIPCEQQRALFNEMLKYLETARKALPIKGSRTNQQTSDIATVPENHTPPTRAQLQDNSCHRGLTCWYPNLGFWQGRSKTGAIVKSNNAYVKAESNFGAEVQPPPPLQPKQDLPPESESLFDNKVGAEPTLPLQPACSSGSQRRKNKKGKAVPRPPRTQDYDERITDEPVRLMLRQVGAKKVPRLPLLGHVLVGQLDHVVLALPNADVDEDVVAEPVCYHQ